MIRFLYNLVLLLILPGVVLYHYYRSKSRGRRSAFRERFGLIPEEDLARIRGERVIWLHAVSVGETIASFPLLKGLRARYPKHRLVLTNVTETGRSVALKSGLADLCLYLPFDYGFAVRAALGKVRPELIILMETELWPNFIDAAAGMRVPVLLANGRISDRSFGRYLRLRWFFRPILEQLSALCMQTGVDATRITAIGAAPDTVHVTGNLKYDVPLVQATQQRVAEIKGKYLIPGGAFVFTAASTHDGEDEPALDAYQGLLAGGGAHFLILAPRHPERAPAVAELLARRGIPFTLRSQLPAGGAALPVGGALLLDTVGELAGLYGASDLVFVGGSLVATGGHNPLEPASCGVPVLFGPHMENFREIAALFLAAGAGAQVPDAAGLARAVAELAGSDASRLEMGRCGTGLMQQCSGATERHLEIAALLLSGAQPKSGTAARAGSPAQGKP
jgi:3-deoxy-D-manno-octulosonic-acid transferase